MAAAIGDPGRPEPGGRDWWPGAEQAHYLRNELAVIRAAVQMAAEQCGSERAREHLRRALAAIERSSSALQQLLERRVGEGGWPLERLYLPSFLERVLGDFADLFSRCGIRVSLDLDPRAPAWAWGSPRLLQAALGNILVNAAEAMPSGGTLRVLVAPGPPPALPIPAMQTRRWAWVCVEDSGPGISSEVLSTLFRAPVSTKPGQGAGMGLLVAHETVTRLHGGHLAALNGPHGGAQVWMGIPAPFSAEPGGEAGDALEAGPVDRTP